MKKILVFLAIVLSGYSILAQVVADKLTGAVNNGKFVLNNIEIGGNWKVQPLIEFLGAPDRVLDGSNKVHTYDGYGIALFERQKAGSPTDTLLELQVYFSEIEKNTVTPAGLYAGSFKIEKLKITKDFTSEELLKKLKDYKQSDSYMPHNFRFSKNGVYIYFQFSDDEKSLQKISIGRDVSE